MVYFVDDVCELITRLHGIKNISIMKEKNSIIRNHQVNSSLMSQLFKEILKRFFYNTHLDGRLPIFGQVVKDPEAMNV